MMIIIIISRFLKIELIMTIIMRFLKVWINDNKWTLRIELIIIIIMRFLKVELIIIIGF